MGEEIIKRETEALQAPDTVFLVAKYEERIKVAESISKAVSAVIEKQGLFSEIQGNKYVKCEGWTTLGALLPRSVTPVAEYVKEIKEGYFEAKINLVSNGQTIGSGISAADMDEKSKAGNKKWQTRSAAMSMAQTRATSKAFRLAFSWVIVLAGYKPTPAEEMEDAIVDAEVVHEIKPNAEPKEDTIVLEKKESTQKNETTGKEQLWSFILIQHEGKDISIAVKGAIDVDQGDVIEVYGLKSPKQDKKCWTAAEIRRAKA